MSIHDIALVVGLFVAPAWLAWYGHRMRGRSQRARGIFWGGVTGNGIAVVIVTILLLAPPVQWAGGDTRTLIVYWGILAGTAAGVCAGALRS